MRGAKGLSGRRFGSTNVGLQGKGFVRQAGPTLQLELIRSFLNLEPRGSTIDERGRNIYQVSMDINKRDIRKANLTGSEHREAANGPDVAAIRISSVVSRANKY